MIPPHINFNLLPIKERINGKVVTERWVPVEGYEKSYMISNFGRIKALERKIALGNGYRQHEEMILKQSEYKQGYLYILLPVKKQKSGKRYKHHKIHILVAQAFVSNPENKPFVNHIKGNKKDNRAWMLEWCTQQENIRHAFKLGLRSAAKGEASPSAKLKRSDVLKIRQMHSDGYSFSEISAMFNISRVHASDIVQRKRWKHIL